MGEAKRRRAAGETPRSWATGLIKVTINGIEVFEWSGTRDEAVDLQKRYLTAVTIVSPFSAESFAARSVGYLIAYGMPRAGDLDRRPSSLGLTWAQGDIDVLRASIPWAALHEHIPNAGQKLEDAFVGKVIVVEFSCGARSMLEETARELRGEPFSGEKFQMIVAVIDDDYQLDPTKAVSITFSDLLRLAGEANPEEQDNELIYVPRIPINAAEACAMLGMMTVVADATTEITPEILADPSLAVRTYAGYTQAELRRGRTAVIVK